MTGGVADKSDMPARDPRPYDPAVLRSGRRALAGIILACIAVELVLQGADHGLWGSRLWRGLSYQYGGFWAGLLHDWQSNYRGQAALMFLTYSWLHAGLGHLIGNMLGMAFLGDLVAERVGGRRLIGLYATSAFGGAAAFGILSHSPAPMIGASGAIFGLAGALTVWDAQDRRRQDKWNRAPLIIVGLAALNFGTWVMQSGNLAWQAHLGGFLAGAAVTCYPRVLAKIRS
ncbi:MAG: rhomboid family intramembrane serine protease [Paracoccaceae bacterium]